jgi:hypothetical protein
MKESIRISFFLSSWVMMFLAGMPLALSIFRGGDVSCGRAKVLSNERKKGLAT